MPDFAAEMALEYGLAARMIMAPDFAEGVRALMRKEQSDEDLARLLKELLAAGASA